MGRHSRTPGPAARRLADDNAKIHDDLVHRLRVQAGEQWLDLATGTGAIATRAVRQGAVVTGQDLAPRLIETARRLAAEDGLDITYEVGDCESLPYPTASFDVVSSGLGVIAAPDHAAVARDRRAQLRNDFIEHLDQYRTADGIVAMPREYLIVLGHRKSR